MSEKIELPCSVRRYVEQSGFSESYVRRAIERGLLKADTTVRPMQIVGGEMPLTIAKWKARLAPAVAKLKRGLWGWSDDGTLEILVRDRVETIPPSESWEDVPRAEAMIESLAGGALS